jgi:hypothetical protein
LLANSIVPAQSAGDNASGQLGAGTTTACVNGVPCSLTPVAAGLPSGVTATAIAAGSNYSLALDP